MGLPKIAVPEYSLKLPSTGEEIKYRPFLVKEEKILLLAMEGEDPKEIMIATKNVIKNCVFGELNVDTLPIFDIEYIFLWLRGRAKGERVDLNYKCPECEAQIPMSFNIDDIKIHKDDNHEKKIELTTDLGVMMKYPTMQLQADIEENKDLGQVELLFKTIRLCIDYIYDAEKMYANKDHTEQEMVEFLESLTDVQFKKISNFFETSPKLQHKVKLNGQSPSKKTKDKGKKK